MNARYYYTGRDAAGKFVTGALEASSEGAALAALRGRALFVTSVASATSAAGVLAGALQAGTPARKHLTRLFRALAQLVQAGVPLRRSLDVCIEQCAHGLLRESLRAIAADIEHGLSLSEAMERHPREFNAFHIAAVRAGEAGGVLDDVLDRMAAVLERELAVRKRIAASLAYPSFVLAAAGALVVFLVSSIVPSFETMYAQMHVPLPPSTSMLIAAGHVLRTSQVWAAVAALVAIAVPFAGRLFASPRGRELWAAVALRTPVFGTIIRKATLATIARTTGTLLRSGVPLAEALRICAGAVQVPAYRRTLDVLRTALAEGSSVSAHIGGSAMFDAVFRHMVQVGEETGTLDAMLLRAAGFYDQDVEAALHAAGSLIEPAMMLLVGGAVGSIVAALFIPLYTLVGSIR